MRRALSLIVGMLSLQTHAADLPRQLEQFFKTRDVVHAAELSVVIRTPASQWPQCPTPQFSLPGNGRLWGHMSVAVNCDQERRYLQVEVQATGEYLVAAQHVTRGTAVSAADLRLKQGRLDRLPARTLLTQGEALNAISLRDLQPDQPITAVMIRQPWRVKAGQQVTVIARGEGFSAVAEGRAMNNATATQAVRVRMGNGQIVSGKATADGNILISL
ncbi:flagellar basal body P-ring biosynthesis protein FlgA [[Pantoea] beijingensis]|uniref:Flagella basal body P-ring formation protein FlgA n=1 Tax=[Pantoea] beijingensis TaxID=1324864 RepID=A0A443IDF7_9GAMM|nr:MULTISPECIES: flagellar basal body P-ring formation chaperone FlgA [Erwiniaceae]RWR01930.1 flagellar basal body P-ring biosynthesis protein FlgA [[Pantoea] beijingensis]